MKRMSLSMAPIILTGLVLCADGYVHGVLINRWHSSPDIKLATSALDAVPNLIGEWRSESRPPLSDRETQLAGFDGYIYRGYKHRQTGAVINVLLACGRPGPLSVHTPDVCYRGSGYQAKTIVKTGNEIAVGDFWLGRFVKPDIVESNELRVFWAWNAKGNWQASINPRFEFAGAPVLYKLYVIQESLRGDPYADETCRDFLNELVPALTKSLSKQP